MNTCIHKKGVNMPTSVRLPEETEKRLAALALETGRSKAFYIREAILKYIDDMEDVYLAEKRIEDMKRSGEQTIPLENLMEQYGLES
jgi:RHH-type rel operon transcriptional repressor/antitoxin RelB